MTVVFPIYRGSDAKDFILLGEHRKFSAIAKKLILNGYGGKKESNETLLGCANREFEEETGIVVSKKDLKLAGRVKAEDKEIYFYIYPTTEMVIVPDSKDMRDNTWFEVRSELKYVHDLLPGDEEVIRGLQIFLAKNPNLENIKNSYRFDIDKTGNQELAKQTAGIYSDIPRIKTFVPLG